MFSKLYTRKVIATSLGSHCVRSNFICFLNPIIANRMRVAPAPAQCAEGDLFVLRDRLNYFQYTMHIVSETTEAQFWSSNCIEIVLILLIVSCEETKYKFQRRVTRTIANLHIMNLRQLHNGTWSNLVLNVHNANDLIGNSSNGILQ